MNPEISIVITAWNRAGLLRPTLESIRAQGHGEELEILVVEDGNDGGKTREVAMAYDARYFRLERPDVAYRNPARPVNVGLRRANGQYVILQNAECAHEAGDVIERLVAPIRQWPSTVTFAQVRAHGPLGEPGMWYCHKRFSARPYFFCGALAREAVLALRGMDEDFEGYGYDDDDFAARLAFAGMKFQFTDAPVRHQWHKPVGCPNLASNKALFEEKIRRMMAGKIGVERNLGREWGAL